MDTSRSVWLVQLPIPPLGPEPIRGNVPLAAGYLKLWAERKGMGAFYDIRIFPARDANLLCDRDLVAALAERVPWLVGFTCYLWNIERTLWIARELKRLRPEVRIVLGGPEITPDNSWVLESPAYDFAVIGEGEQTFTQLLLGLVEGETVPPVPIPGLYVPPPSGPRWLMALSARCRKSGRRKCTRSSAAQRARAPPPTFRRRHGRGAQRERSDAPRARVCASAPPPSRPPCPVKPPDARAVAP